MMRSVSNQDGFTFVLALTVVMIMGIMLGMAGQSWKMVMQREQEKELIFRGSQIRDAIENWYTPRPGQHVVTPLADLKFLVEDPRQQRPVHWLRRLYDDPMTGKPDWRVITDPNKGIIGVASTSTGAVIRSDFSDIPSLAGLSGKKKYSEWEFVYDPNAKIDKSKSYNSYYERW